MILLLAGVLMAIPFDARSDRKIEKTYKKAENTKTWVVVDPAGHMEVGDKFRIKFTANGSRFQLIPLFAMRTKWGHKGNPGFLVDLDDENKFLCGMTEINTAVHKNNTVAHGSWHGFVVKVTDVGDLEITWSDQSFKKLNKSERKEMCDATSEQSHGGKAHAEPN